MTTHPHIMELIKKGKFYGYHKFFWKEKDEEFTIIAAWSVLYALAPLAEEIWECNLHNEIRELDRDSAIGYFKIGGKHGKFW